MSHENVPIFSFLKAELESQTAIFIFSCTATSALKTKIEFRESWRQIPFQTVVQLVVL